MSALLIYRSRNSFESRFGRNTPDPSQRQKISSSSSSNSSRELGAPLPNEHREVHNEGHKRTPLSNQASGNSSRTDSPALQEAASETASPPQDNGNYVLDPQFTRSATLPSPTQPPTPSGKRKRATTYFSAQSYLRYQGDKFVRRFDSNCYIAITRKLDTHDVTRGRIDAETPDPVAKALGMIRQPALVIGIESDGLFTFKEQEDLAAGIPNARLRNINSPEGHDAFLLQFKQVNQYILDFLHEVLPDIMQKPPPSHATRDDELTTTDIQRVGQANSQAEDVPSAKPRTTLIGEDDTLPPPLPVGDITAW